MSSLENTKHDVEDEVLEPMTQEEMLMSEQDILAGILAVGKESEEGVTTKLIQIRREGKVQFQFRVQILSEDEQQACWKRATKYAKAKPGQPKKAIETNPSLFRSHMIYAATVAEDRAKVWDNRTAMDAFNIINPVEMVDKLLRPGEKSRVIDEIELLGGYEDDMEELGKN